jgi:hypothetical protein
VFIPKGACWLNLQEGWWRLFRRDAFAGHSFANAEEIERVMRVATEQLNHRAKPWKLIWLKTYGFMGPFYEGELKGRWARSCQELARRFPNDGANFCVIWQRI